MKTPSESYQRQCDWSEGWDAAEVNFEKRLDTMAEEYEALLKESQRIIAEYEQYIDDIGLKGALGAPSRGMK